MEKIKSVAIFSALGFVLSFISGFFSHGSFVRIFFTAIFVALIFALLGFVISIVFERLLNFSDSENASSSQADEKAVGSKVDIVLEDEALPQGDKVAQFAVGENHQMLKPEDFESRAEQEAKAQKKDSGFVPIGLTENAERLQGKEANVKSVAKGDAKKDETLDELPNLEHLVSSDSDDVTFVPNAQLSVSGASKKVDREFAGQGAEVMAKAISTVLAHDKDS